MDRNYDPYDGFIQMLAISFKNNTGLAVAIVAVGILAMLAAGALLLYGRAYHERLNRPLGISPASSSILASLQAERPALSSEQAYRYFAQEGRGGMESCEDLAAVDDCKFTIAFIRQDTNLCGDIESQAEQRSCANAVASRNTDDVLAKCQHSTNADSKAACIVSAFLLYRTEKECGFFTETDKNRLCNDVVLYQQALAGGGQSSCSLIQEAVLKSHCSGVFVAGDYDHDGLSDFDEQRKFRTDPYQADTDNDGHADADEIKAGFDPLSSSTARTNDH